MTSDRTEYAEVIDERTRHGLATNFRQIGGMNAALEVRLDRAATSHLARLTSQASKSHGA